MIVPLPSFDVQERAVNQMREVYKERGRLLEEVDKAVDNARRKVETLVLGEGIQFN